MKRKILVTIMISALLTLSLSVVEVFNSHAVAEADESEHKEIISSGSCAATAEDKVTYCLYEDGTLTISGEGAMVEGAFASNENIKKIIIEEGITVIGENAFANCCNLEAIQIPSTIVTIASASLPVNGNFAGKCENPFWGCSEIEEIKVASGNAVYSSESDSNALVRLEDNTLVVGCKNTIIPQVVKNIGNGAFIGCTGLEEIIIPDSVTAIGDNSFNGCSSLKKITLPESLNSIGHSTFRNCSALTDVQLPEKLTSLQSYAFGGCSSLVDINIPDSLTALEDGVFDGCTSIKCLEFPASIKTIGNGSISDIKLVCMSKNSELDISNVPPINIKIKEKEDYTEAKHNISGCCGDFDGDNKVKLNDVTASLRFALGIDKPTEEQELYGDYDGNGIGLSDTVVYLKMSLMEIFDVSEADFNKYYYYKINLNCADDYDFDNFSIATKRLEEEELITVDFGVSDVQATKINSVKTIYFKVLKSDMYKYSKFVCENYYR